VITIAKSQDFEMLVAMKATRASEGRKAMKAIQCRLGRL